MRKKPLKYRSAGNWQAPHKSSSFAHTWDMLMTGLIFYSTTLRILKKVISAIMPCNRNLLFSFLLGDKMPATAFTELLYLTGSIHIAAYQFEQWRDTTRQPTREKILSKYRIFYPFPYWHRSKSQTLQWYYVSPCHKSIPITTPVCSFIWSCSHKWVFLKGTSRPHFT